MGAGRGVVRWKEAGGRGGNEQATKKPAHGGGGLRKGDGETRIVLRSSGLGPAARKLVTTDVNSVFRLGAELEGPGHQLRRVALEIKTTRKFVNWMLN
jgi:hypothetical protein